MLSDKWDADEADLDFFSGGKLEDYTALELLYIIKRHVERSPRYGTTDRDGLLRAAERDINKILGK